MKRLDLAMFVALLPILVCSHLLQSSTARALAQPAYASRQLLWLVLGAVLLLLFAFSDYRLLLRLAPLFYVAALLALAAMLFLAPLRAGTRSWLVLGPYTVQPSEFARIAAILAAAALGARYQKELLAGRTALQLTAVVAAPALLVALQPDLGVALTFVPILLAVLWLGGLPWRTWVVLALSVLLLAAAAWLWYLKPYQRERILTFLEPDRAPAGAGYQQRQSRIAVGSGGLTGKGLRSGTQSQLRFLPAQDTDFIFAVWAEETGFVGSVFLVLCYATVALRLFAIALAARDRGGTLLAATVAVVFTTQTLVNMAMVVGLAPTTGITLPLLSRGGSSLLATCISLGLAQSVWRLRFANL
jgi:rod shape determining protein RodA